jgi:steroid 5-alpha reductase family enzyme
MEFLNLGTSPLYICLALMVVAFFFALRLHFFSLVDVVWSYLFTIVAFVYAAMPSAYRPRQYLLLFLVSFWSLRLGTHLFLRLRSHYPQEDGRYIDLRVKWAKNLKFNFFVFYLFQGLSVVVLSLPFLLIAMNPREEFHWLEYLGVAVWAIGLFGESTSDQQLKRFKLDAANKGQVCQTGLWNYSRHPNYFFEWLVWVGYFLLAVSAPNGWLALISPMIIFYLLVKMTGIPYTEAQSIKSRGEKYREYQRTTSAFVPWFKKNK